jgi:iron-sulfur cluster repair protein YtfE (RIC family)
MSNLPHVAHEHHERLMAHIEEMPAIGRAILDAPADELHARLADLDGWLTGLLLPHMDAAEATLYPELERMMQNRHSMKPMRREHEEIRRLVGELSGLITGVGEKRPSLGKQIALRRVLYRLYALLEIHAVEEEMYIPLVQHGITDEASEAMAAALRHPGVADA